MTNQRAMPPLRRPVLLGALTAIVALFIVTPVASSSFLGDDLFNSNMNGYLSANHLTLLQMSWVSTSAFLVSTSRFLPASPLEGFGVFTVFHDLAAYKAFQVGMLLLDLVLFGLFLRALRVGVGAAALSGLLVAATMQFHGHYDGYLGFSALTEYVLALMLGSWILFAAFLRGAGARALVAAFLLYLLGVLTYETCYPLSVVHVLIAVHLRGRQGWRASLPFLALSGIALAGLLVGRVVFPQHGTAAYALHLDPRAYLPTVINQLSASIPLSYLGFHQQLFASQDAFWMTTPWWLLLALVAAAAPAAFIALRSAAVPPRTLAVPAAIGAIIWVVPALLLAAIPRYQREVQPGYGYIWMVIEGFGAALVMGCGLALLAAALRGTARTVVSAVLAVAYALVIAATFVTNARTLETLEGERSAHIDVTSALRDGILAGVPDGATLETDSPAQLLNRGTAASDGRWLASARYWIYQESGRVIRVHGIAQNPPELACSRPACSPAGVYALRDVAFDPLNGYALAGRTRSSVASSDGSAHQLVDDVRVHVRGDRLAQFAERGPLVLSYPCGTPATVAHSPVVATPDAIRRGTTVRIEQRCAIDIEQATLQAPS